MPPLIFGLILRNVARNKLRTLLTVLGIALGIAILLAIRLANESTLARFEDNLSRVSGKANLEVRSVSQPAFDSRLIGRLRWIWLAGGQFTPVVEGTAIMANTQKTALQILGIDAFTHGNFESQPAQNNNPAGPAGLDWFNARQILITRSLAKQYHLKQGDAIPVLINAHQVFLTVAGFLNNNELSQAYGGNIVLMDLAGAQDVLNRGNQISHVDILAPAAALKGIYNQLQKRLPPGLIVQTPRQRSAQTEKMLQAFQQNLTALSVIALLVGAFLVYNTMSIAIVRRRPEIATLRALGTSQVQIFMLFAAEALILGTLGSLLGVGLGILMAKGALSAVSTTVQTLYAGAPTTALTLSPLTLAIVFVLGVGMSLIASLPPLLEAATVQPATASRRLQIETRLRRSPLPLLVLSALLGLLAWWSALQPAWGNFPLFGYLSAFFVILGAAFAVPMLILGILRLISPLTTAVLGIDGTLAIASLKGALGRTSVAVASLMVGIAMMVSLALMISSFRQTVIGWVNQTLRADIWIEPAVRTYSKQSGHMDAALIAQVRAVPGVAAVDPFIEQPFLFHNRVTNLGSGDINVLAHYGKLSFLNHQPAQPVYQAMETALACIVSETFAIKFHVHLNDLLTLPTPDGPKQLRVNGIYYDYASEQGTLIIARRLYTQWFHDTGATGLAVYLHHNESGDAVRNRLVNLMARDVRLTIRTNKELRAEVLRIFDQTFAITYALHIIAIVVALLGVMNTLFTLVSESRWELGVLKTLGMDGSGIRKMVLVQACLLGVLGYVVGLIVGLILSIILIMVVNKQSFGWTIHLSFPWLFLAQSFILVVLTALISGILPARLAAKTPAPEALRTE